MNHEGVPTESGTFELLAAVKTVTKLEKPDIVFGDRINQVPCGPKLTKSEFVMIFVVQDIYERGQEGVEFLMATSTISTQNAEKNRANVHRA
jgi:hypothetical protein